MQPHPNATHGDESEESRIKNGLSHSVVDGFGIVPHTEQSQPDDAYNIMPPSGNSHLHI
jgi:hypothetical protein